MGNEQLLAIAHEPLGPGPGLDWTGRWYLGGAPQVIIMEWVRTAERRKKIAEESWESACSRDCTLH